MIHDTHRIKNRTQAKSRYVLVVFVVTFYFAKCCICQLFDQHSPNLSTCPKMLPKAKRPEEEGTIEVNMVGPSLLQPDAPPRGNTPKGKQGIMDHRTRAIRNSQILSPRGSAAQGNKPEVVDTHE